MRTAKEHKIQAAVDAASALAMREAREVADEIRTMTNDPLLTQTEVERLACRVEMEIIVALLNHQMEIVDPEVFDPHLVLARENVNKAIEACREVERSARENVRRK